MPASPSQNKDPIFSETEFEEDQTPKQFKDHLIDIYYDAIPLFNLNVAWFLLSLPLVTLFPALGGLYHALLRYNRKEPVNRHVFWEGVKKNWLASLKWGGVVLLGDLLLAVNIWFSLSIEAGWSLYTLIVRGTIALIWATINQFSFPMLLLQEEKKVLLAIRNGYVIVARRPWDALKVSFLNLLIAAVSVFIPPFWFFITMALIAHLQTKTVLRAVEKIRAQDEENDAAKAHSEGTRSEDEGQETLEQEN